MFTALRNIFTRPPRQAESSDTRQEIRRQDPDQQRRKPKNNDRNEAKIFGDYDEATVSVKALRLFLKNLLKSAGANPQVGSSQKKETPVPPARPSPSPEQRAPEAESPAARAAGVYEAASRKEHSGGFSIDDTPAAPPAESVPLKSEEMRTIHALLADLQILSEKKVEYLRIERSETFLDSLVQAVEKAKAAGGA